MSIMLRITRIIAFLCPRGLSRGGYTLDRAIEIHRFLVYFTIRALDGGLTWSRSRTDRGDTSRRGLSRFTSARRGERLHISGVRRITSRDCFSRFLDQHFIGGRIGRSALGTDGKFCGRCFGLLRCCPLDCDSVGRSDNTVRIALCCDECFVLFLEGTQCRVVHCVPSTISLTQE